MKALYSDTEKVSDGTNLIVPAPGIVAGLRLMKRPQISCRLPGEGEKFMPNHGWI